MAPALARRRLVWAVFSLRRTSRHADAIAHAFRRSRYIPGTEWFSIKVSPSTPRSRRCPTPPVAVCSSSLTWRCVNHRPRREVRHDPTGMKKHVSVLEQAGPVATRKVGRVTDVHARDVPPRTGNRVDRRHRQPWEARFDALDAVVAALNRQRSTAAGKGSGVSRMHNPTKMERTRP